MFVVHGAALVAPYGYGGEFVRIGTACLETVGSISAA